MISLLLAVIAMSQIEPDECWHHWSLGTGTDIVIACEDLPCSGPTLITVYPWGRLETCHAGIPDPNDPSRWGNFCISTIICGSEVDPPGLIFADGFESGNLSAWR